jgi:hypothetical protein
MVTPVTDGKEYPGRIFLCTESTGNKKSLTYLASQLFFAMFVLYLINL